MQRKTAQITPSGTKMQGDGQEPRQTFRVAPKIATIRLGFRVHLGNPGYDRYQARVTWLLALAGMLIIIQLTESSPNKSLSGRVRPGGGNDAGGV